MLTKGINTEDKAQFSYATSYIFAVVESTLASSPGWSVQLG